MSADGRDRARDRRDRAAHPASDWPRKAIGLPAYLVKDWGTTLRTVLLLGAGNLTAESLGTPDVLTHHLVGAFEAVQLSGAWVPWSMLGCVGTAEAVRIVRARRASFVPAAPQPAPDRKKPARGKKDKRAKRKVKKKNGKKKVTAG